MFESNGTPKSSRQTLERPLLISVIRRLSQDSDESDGQLVITETRLIFARNEIIQRILLLTEIDAITLSTSSSQFIIHAKSQADELILSSKNKKDILKVLVGLIQKSSRQKVGLYIVDDSKLDMYTTIQEDLEDGHVIRPSRCDLFMIDSVDLSFNQTLRQTDPITQFRKAKPQSSSYKSGFSNNILSYQLLKTLGKGAYGKVVLAQNRADSSLMSAIKVLQKKDLIAKNQIPSVKIEHEILSSISHPFLVRMQSAFQSQNQVYFAMDFMIGGELFQHLRQRRTLTEEQAKFTVACLILAIGHLHDSGYIYRDLKPENILLSGEGYPMLADFGLAAKARPDELVKEFCGTAEYLAPEIIIQKGYNRPADWWALGVLSFEMLFGSPPFYSHDVQDMYKKTLTTPLRFPKQTNVSRLAQDFCAGLLMKSASQRLGSIIGSVELMHHPWFANFDWDKLLLNKVRSPVKSWISERDWEPNFDSEFLNEDPNSIFEESNGNSSPKDAHLFSFMIEKPYRFNSQRSDFQTKLSKVLMESQQSEAQECFKVNRGWRENSHSKVLELHSLLADSSSGLVSA